MKRSGFLTLLLVAAVVTACSRILPVTVFNNTGEAIEVLAGPDTGTIAPGKFAEFRYNRFADGRAFSLARIFSGGCEYLYDFPAEIADYQIDMTYERGVQVQVEKDFSINLLPKTYDGDAPASGDMVLQREGFPVHPVAKKCR